MATGFFAGAVAVLIPLLIAAKHYAKAPMHNTPSPDNSDHGIERAIQAAGADVAPRVTPQRIKDVIVSEHYFTAAEGANFNDGTPVKLVDPGPLDLLTFCVLVLRNGFTVTGESACASPENFNEEIGRRVARENAVQKIWQLEGYLLKQRLSEG